MSVEETTSRRDPTPSSPQDEVARGVLQDPHPARTRGVRWLKVYGVIYLLLIVFFAVHRFTASMEVPVEGLEPGLRLWETLVFEVDGRRDEIAENTVLSPEMVSHLRASSLATLQDETGEPARITVHKKNCYQNWPALFAVWNFLGLALLLYTALGDLVPSALDDYARRQEAEIAAAREARAGAEALEARHAEMLAEMEQERARMQKKADEDATHEYKRIIHQTHEDITRMREALKRHLESEAYQAAASLRGEFAAKVTARARERLAGAVERPVHEALVGDFIRELKGRKIS